MVNNLIPLEKELTFSRFDYERKIPDKTAVLILANIFPIRLRNLSERFAGGLRRIGVNKGDKVLLYIPNCIQWVIAISASRKPEPSVPVSPIYTSHEISYMIKDSGKTIVCMDTNFGYVKEAFAKTD
jgi:long-chain acyl-CoA synthetase